MERHQNGMDVWVGKGIDVFHIIFNNINETFDCVLNLTLLT